MLIWSIVGVPKVCRFLYCTNCTNDRKNKWHFFLSFLATNQLPLSPVQIQPSPPYYRQPSQDDGRKVYIYIYWISDTKSVLYVDVFLERVSV